MECFRHVRVTFIVVSARHFLKINKLALSEPAFQAVCQNQATPLQQHTWRLLHSIKYELDLDYQQLHRSNLILEVVLKHRCQLICLHSASYVLIYETLLTVGSVGTVAAHPKPVGATGAVFNF